jgi:hypothetical protein
VLQLNSWTYCLALALPLACVSCGPSPDPGSGSDAEKLAKQGVTAPTGAAAAAPGPPAQFGFQVVSVEKESCCSDVPGKPSPLPYSRAVEGLTPDGTRLALDCSPSTEVVKTSSGWKARQITTDEWYELHTAFIEHEDYGDILTINKFDVDAQGKSSWRKLVACTILNRLDDARDLTPIYVSYSKHYDSSAGSGYEVIATGATDSYELACVQDSKTACVSVKPGWYKAVRNDSAFRLCDQDLTVISTYRIMSEAARR